MGAATSVFTFDANATGLLRTIAQMDQAARRTRDEYSRLKREIGDISQASETQRQSLERANFEMQKANATVAALRSSFREYNNSLRESQLEQSKGITQLGAVRQAAANLGYMMQDLSASYNSSASAAQNFANITRAVGDNATFTAAMINPMLGAMVGLGTAAATFTASWFAGQSKTNDALQKTKELLLENRRIMETTRFGAEQAEQRKKEAEVQDRLNQLQIRRVELERQKFQLEERERRFPFRGEADRNRDMEELDRLTSPNRFSTNLDPEKPETYTNIPELLRQMAVENQRMAQLREKEMQRIAERQIESDSGLRTALEMRTIAALAANQGRLYDANNQFNPQVIRSITTLMAEAMPTIQGAQLNQLAQRMAQDVYLQQQATIAGRRAAGANTPGNLAEQMSDYELRINRRLEELKVQGMETPKPSDWRVRANEDQKKVLSDSKQILNDILDELRRGRTTPAEAHQRFQRLQGGMDAALAPNIEDRMIQRVAPNNNVRPNAAPPIPAGAQPNRRAPAQNPRLRPPEIGPVQQPQAPQENVPLPPAGMGNNREAPVPLAQPTQLEMAIIRGDQNLEQQGLLSEIEIRHLRDEEARLERFYQMPPGSMRNLRQDVHPRPKPTTSVPAFGPMGFIASSMFGAQEEEKPKTLIDIVSKMLRPGSSPNMHPLMAIERQLWRTPQFIEGSRETLDLALDSVDARPESIRRRRAERERKRQEELAKLARPQNFNASREMLDEWQLERDRRRVAEEPVRDVPQAEINRLVEAERRQWVSPDLQNQGVENIERSEEQGRRIQQMQGGNLSPSLVDQELEQVRKRRAELEQNQRRINERTRQMLGVPVVDREVDFWGREHPPQGPGRGVPPVDTDFMRTQRGGNDRRLPMHERRQMAARHNEIRTNLGLESVDFGLPPESPTEGKEAERIERQRNVNKMLLRDPFNAERALDRMDTDLEGRESTLERMLERFASPRSQGGTGITEGEQRIIELLEQGINALQGRRDRLQGDLEQKYPGWVRGFSGGN